MGVGSSIFRKALQKSWTAAAGVLFGALHCTAASSQTALHKNSLSPWFGGTIGQMCHQWMRGSPRDSLAHWKHAAPWGERPVLLSQFSSPQLQLRFCWVCCHPLRKTWRVQGFQGLTPPGKVRSRCPCQDYQKNKESENGPPPPFCSNELLICLSRVWWNNSLQSISAQH